jgi:hypothetical protein
VEETAEESVEGSIFLLGLLEALFELADLLI